MLNKHIELALNNIDKYGDTDIFPYPIEKYIFYDSRKEVLNYIKEIDKSFYDYIDSHPPVNIDTFSPIGYTGYRWATQIDPVWNAYLLSLVISIGEKIEKERIGLQKNIIHSYRLNYNYSNATLYDEDYNWKTFQTQSLDNIKEDNQYSHVVICDISDFYNRIYHHKLENALLRLKLKNDTPKRIMKILQKFSRTNSYGLPIGGPAARILAELALNNTDKILQIEGVKFTRFVDDIHLFAKSEEDAHALLNNLAIRLMSNEGLTLQKHKTQILTKAEFTKLISARLNADSEDSRTNHRAKFMSLPIRYDPYSPTADKEYRKIKRQLKEFDILGLLNEELRKTRIHQQFSKHLLKSLSVLNKSVVSQAFLSISNRLDQLYPIFSNIMMAASANYEKLDDNTKKEFFIKLRSLVKEKSFILNVELNVAYLVRVLAKDHTLENEEVLAELYKRFHNSILVKSWITQVFINWEMAFWLSDIKRNFQTMSKWERRVFIIGSYFMKDEGKHWRNHNKKEFSAFEIIVRDWTENKIKDENWRIPL